MFAYVFGLSGFHWLVVGWLTCCFAGGLVVICLLCFDCCRLLFCFVVMILLRLWFDSAALGFSGLIACLFWLHLVTYVLGLYA